MKHLLIILLLAGVPASVLAQRHLRGQCGLTPYVGVVDNWPRVPLTRNGQGYLVGLDFTKYGSKEGYWKIGYQFDRKYYARPAGAAALLTTDRHLLSVDVSVHPFHDHRRRFYAVPTLGAHVGYERVNGNSLTLPEGQIQNRSTGLLGLQAGLEGELFLSDHWSLVGQVQERFLPYSHVALFRTYGTLGLRISFFTN